MALLTVAAAAQVPGYQKIRPLLDALAGKAPATEADVSAMLDGALADPDWFVRQEVVGSIANVLLASHMPKDAPQVLLKWRSVAETFLPKLPRLLKDEDSGVRRETV